MYGMRVLTKKSANSHGDLGVQQLLEFSNSAGMPDCLAKGVCKERTHHLVERVEEHVTEDGRVSLHPVFPLALVSKEIHGSAVLAVRLQGPVEPAHICYSVVYLVIEFMRQGTHLHHLVQA